MVINSNLIGSSGTPLTSAADRLGSKGRIAGSPQPPGMPSAVNSEVRTFADAGSEIADTAAAGDGIQAARAGILGQPGTAMLAQANLSPDMVLSLLQD